MILDSHVHFIDYQNNKDDYPWIDSNMDVLKQELLPQQLYHDSRISNVNSVIAIQAVRSIKETEWLLKLATENDFIAGVVGWVDLSSNSALINLRKLSKNNKFIGVRNMLQDRENIDFMLSDDFCRGISSLSLFDISYDLLIKPEHIENASKLVSKYPDIKFIVDHMAKPCIKDQKFEGWKEDMIELSKYENVACKLSGLVTEADTNNWKFADFTGYLDIIFQNFGSNRVIYGSDWPVHKLASTYRQQFSIINDYIINNTSNVKQTYEKIFFRNALSFYPRLKISNS
ncbi:amidohydrolase [Francisella halioticida]|uniref:Amidohydrolase n=1 Tax=Francisella halioticida TaxID=549298 RepID=A0ABM6M1N4_9GAMM|nr:amidohydrolase family protein [Francisella halioticida]ASG68764.1 amidohydrolase [Francisella halioticida]